MHDELVNRLKIAAEWAGKGFCITPNLCLEAATAIEELQENSMPMGDVEMILEEVMKPYWIPILEKLPDEGKFVLIYGDLYPNKHDGGSIAISKRMDWNYWQGFGRERNITHWMPLPEPPKEKI